MARLHISPAAEADLDDIWFYIAVDDLATADRFVDYLFLICGKLARSPGLGRERPELGSGLRSFVVGNYLIFYRAQPKVCEVVRVLSSYRDLPSLFPNG